MGLFINRKYSKLQNCGGAIHKLQIFKFRKIKEVAVKRKGSQTQDGNVRSPPRNHLCLPRAIEVQEQFCMLQSFARRPLVA